MIKLMNKIWDKTKEFFAFFADWRVIILLLIGLFLCFYGYNDYQNKILEEQRIQQAQAQAQYEAQKQSFEAAKAKIQAEEDAYHAAQAAKNQPVSVPVSTAPINFMGPNITIPAVPDTSFDTSEYEHRMQLYNIPPYQTPTCNPRMSRAACQTLIKAYGIK